MAGVVAPIRNMLTFGSPILLRWQGFDRDDVLRIQSRDFTIGVQNGHAVTANQDELGVRHRIFVSI